MAESKMGPYYTERGFKPKPRTPEEKRKEAESFTLQGSGYKVWNPDDLKQMPADYMKMHAPIPPGSEKTWPGGGSAGIVDRLPTSSKKALGIKGSNRLGS